MPQDIKKLMDIELCNMVFSYFYMLGRSELFAETKLLDLINNARLIPEIAVACRNLAIPQEQFSNARMLRDNIPYVILSEALLDAEKYRKMKILRSLIYRFA